MKILGICSCSVLYLLFIATTRIHSFGFSLSRLPIRPVGSRCSYKNWGQKFHNSIVLAALSHEGVDENMGQDLYSTLEGSGKEYQFLKQIKDYGNARMARRAIRVLQNMRSCKTEPTVLHFEAALWACEKSDQV